MEGALPEIANLFDAPLAGLAGESFATLLQTPAFRLVRIVSAGHATPEGEWYDQAENEWVVVLKGAAGLRFAGEDEIRVMRAGDHLLIPAHVRHRVEWTDPDGPTVWLALHYS